MRASVSAAIIVLALGVGLVWNPMNSCAVNVAHSEPAEVAFRQAMALLNSSSPFAVRSPGPSALMLASDGASASDTEEAVKYLREAAQLGHDHAMFVLGQLHELGVIGSVDGFEPDLHSAMQWYNASAVAGNDHAQVALAYMYENGLGGLAVNEALALVHYHFAALSGNADAHMALGFRYAYGLGVPRTCTVAAEHYAEAAAHVADDVLRSGVVAVPHRRLVDGARARDDSTLLEYFENVADAGDARAQAVMGHLHLVGQQGVERDHRRAAQLLQRAAAQGDHDAVAALGFMYSLGLGVPRDLGTALRLYQEAVSHGSTAGMAGLGRLYLYGLGVEQHPEKAHKYLQAAARAGNPYAQYFLALMHIDGIGTKRDPVVALQLLSQAAQAGHAGAMYRAALMHLSGIGTPTNCPQALGLLKAVAERGPVMDRLEQAWRLYRDGHAAAARWLWRRLASLGLEDAQSNAAYAMTHALGGPQDELGALRLLRYAAEQGNVAALVQVGDAYYHGHGVPADAAAAVLWYRRAADFRDPQALFNLGWAHHVGDGAARDPHRAKHYYDRAAETSRDAVVPATLALFALRAAVAWQRLAEALPSVPVRTDALALALTALVLLVTIAVRLRWRR